MTNKETLTYTTASLDEVIVEINKRTKEGYDIVQGLNFAEGAYTIEFTRDKSEPAEPVVEAVVPPSPKPQTPAVKLQRGPKPKAKAEAVKESVEA